MNRNRYGLLLFKAKSKSLYKATVFETKGCKECLRIVVLEETYHSDAETRLTDGPASHIIWARDCSHGQNFTNRYEGICDRYFGFMNKKVTDEKLQ